MKKAYSLASLLFFCAFYFSFGQTTIAIQDFDGTAPNWGFSSDVTFFDNGADGFFGIHDGNSVLTDGVPNDTGTGNNADVSIIDYANILSDFLFINDLEDDERAVLKKAVKMVENAYAPYSSFFVGAAVMTDSGSIYGGCNQEIQLCQHDWGKKEGRRR